MSRRRSSSRKIIDKWSTKKIYDIVSPEGFLDQPEKIVGDTLSDEPEKVIGRIIEVPLSLIINDYSKAHIKIQLQIVEIVGETAKTRFKGHTFARDYLRFLVRRRRTRVDSIITLTTKDNIPIRITATAFTRSRAKTSQKDAIRRKMIDTLQRHISEKTLYDFIKESVICSKDGFRDITSGDIGVELFMDGKALFPMKNIDIQKSKILQSLE